MPQPVLSSLLMQGTLFLAPWVGMGVVALGTGRNLGTGIQPAFITAALLLMTLLPAVRRLRGDDLWPVALALGWTVLGLSALWRLDIVGQAGEWPALKGLKQLLMLAFFVALAIAPSVLLSRSPQPRAELRRWERVASLGLLVVTVYALAQAANFYLQLPALERLAAWFSSNPSIESGSEELYLGHRFVGIPRVRSTFCEPLQLGSYLVAAAPVCMAAAISMRGWARLWRLLTGLGAGAALVLTFSRGAYLAAFVVLLLLFHGWRRGHLPRPRGGHMLLGAALGVLVLGGVVAILSGRSVLELPELLLQRIGQSVASHDMSNMTRLYAWTAAWRAFQEAPVLGIGWGGFGFHYYLLAPAGGAGAHFGWPMANNLPLLVLAETGLVGALLWGWAAWPALRALLRPAKPGSRIAPEWWWDWGFAALCAGVLVQTLTFSQWNLPHLWLLAGISAALGRRIRSEPEGLV